MGRAYEQMGMYPQALQAYQSILAFAPHDPALLALLGHLDAVSGQPAAARGIISQLQQISSGKYVPTLYVAMIYTGLGDQDQDSHGSTKRTWSVVNTWSICPRNPWQIRSGPIPGFPRC